MTYTTLGEKQGFRANHVPQVSRLHGSTTARQPSSSRLAGGLAALAIAGGAIYFFPEIKEQLTYTNTTTPVEAPQEQQSSGDQKTVSDELFNQPHTYSLTSAKQYEGLPERITYDPGSNTFSLNQSALENSPGVQAIDRAPGTLESRLSDKGYSIIADCENGSCNLSPIEMADLLDTWNSKGICIGNTGELTDLVRTELPASFYGGKKDQYLTGLEGQQQKYCY